MEETTIQEFVDALADRLGIGFTDEQREAILEADTIRAAQRVADYMGVPQDTINYISSEMELPGLGPTIGAIPEGAELIDPSRVITNEQGQTIVVNPDGSATVVDDPAITPAEQMQQEQIAALEAILGEEDEADKNYLLLGGADYDRTRAIISAPGYTYTYGEGLTAPAIANPIIYEAGDDVSKWAGFSAQVRNSYTEAMIKAGMISEEDAKGLATGSLGRAYGGYEDLGEGYSGASRVQIDAFQEALATAGYLGTTPMAAIFARGETARANPTTGSGSGGRLPFSVPTELRTIPDYETLQQRVTELMRGAMGRDAEDWEIALLADELQSQHRSYNEKMIEAAREAYEGGNRGVGQEIEVPNPVDRTNKFFEETYADEISRRKDIGQAANTNNMMMDALTRGGGMVS